MIGDPVYNEKNVISVKVNFMKFPDESTKYSPKRGPLKTDNVKKDQFPKDILSDDRLR